jgi:non-canonical poly(A) RNA polymerase PAPD5/7
VDFYEHVKPQEFERRIRQDLVNELKDFCRKVFKDAEVYPFGSFPSGLYLPTGDIDLVMCSDSYMDGGRAKYSNKSALYRFRAFLQHNRVAHLNEVELILHAKVPLVKYIDRRTGLKMDVSFENLTGVQALKTFQAWREQYPAMPILVTIIKQYLFMRGLNEPVNGGIGGFSVICLVVSMLQMMPQVQSRSMNTMHHLGDLLLEFFDLYGNRFNYRTTAISLNPPKYIAKVWICRLFCLLMLLAKC